MTSLHLTQEALTRLDEVLAAPRGRRVGVLGLGVAGTAMAIYLARRGARVLGVDQRTDLDGRDLATAGVELSLGPVSDEGLCRLDALVISPGADPRQVAVQTALARGVPVCGELELVGKLQARVAAITGTNGKSTTTALLGALGHGCGQSAFVGGNLGDPIAAWLNRGGVAQNVVLELSSFQLGTAYRFRADVAVVLNLTPDHFERYPDLETYALAKQRLVENMEPSGIAVLNYDDARVRRMADATRARVFWFSTLAATVPGDGAIVAGDVMQPQGAVPEILTQDLSHPRLFGRHNRENAVAAMLAAHALGWLTRETRHQVREAYLAFQGLEHRLELVAEVDGVRFINDSKATNDDAAAIALGAMDRPVVLLAGGRDKGAGYSRLVKAAAGRVRQVIVFGEAKDLLAAAFTGHPGLVRCDGFAAAFAEATRVARQGEVVLLAPACSSFDEFSDYKHRGQEFKRRVSMLRERSS